MSAGAAEAAGVALARAREFLTAQGARREACYVAAVAGLPGREAFLADAAVCQTSEGALRALVAGDAPGPGVASTADALGWLVGLGVTEGRLVESAAAYLGKQQAADGAWRDVAAGDGAWRDVAAGDGAWRDAAAGDGAWRDAAAGDGAWRDAAAGDGAWRDAAAGDGAWRDAAAAGERGAALLSAALCGTLARCPAARLSSLRRAAAYLAASWSEARVRAGSYPEIAGYLHAFASLPGDVDVADEALQWCGRELERGFRTGTIEAPQVAHVFVLCDAAALPGAGLRAAEVLEALLRAQAPDGGFGAWGTPERAACRAALALRHLAPALR